MHELLWILRNEIKGAWRYRWLAVVVAWGICVVGWLYVFSLPNVYQARAEVYVDAQSRLAQVMGQVGVSPEVGSSVFVVRQAMLALPQLKRVAEKTGLDKRASDAEGAAALYGRLAERIQIHSGRSREASHLYSIAFEDHDPEMALAVVEELLNTFVEDVLKLKDRGTEQVDNYLEQQLAYYENQLAAAEQRLADFKKQYVGLLPGESGDVFERLQAELARLAQVETDLQVEIDRRNELRRQIQTEVPYLPQDADGPGGAVVPGSTTAARITELENQRANLLLTFTEQHPDVVAVTEQLEQLYSQQQAQLAAMANISGGIEGVANASNPVYQTAQIALNESNVRIVALESQIGQHRAAVAQLREQINTIPEVEAELAALNRDYDQYRALYSNILLQKERERLGKVDEETDVVTFNVTAPPTVGVDPVGPKRTLMLCGVLIFGLGCAGGLAVVLNRAQPVFHDVEGLRQFLGKPVLGQVSLTQLSEHRRARHADQLTFAAATCALVILFAGMLVLQEPGVRLIRDLLTQTGA